MDDNRYMICTYPYSSGDSNGNSRCKSYLDRFCCRQVNLTQVIGIILIHTHSYSNSKILLCHPSIHPSSSKISFQENQQPSTSSSGTSD